ncbi:MAG TPA: hypothetical protein VEC57_10330 [Candidatus Limnocylindrales bacterium]|nr:hypothetical protein [Candidatus Limnocylindrales bacterium]
MKSYRIIHRSAALAVSLAAAAALSATPAAAECGDPSCAQKEQACDQAKEAGGCGCAGKAEAAADAKAPEGAGVRAYIDPETGELTTPPAAGAAAGAAEADARTAGQAPAIEVPGGGVQAELGAGYRANIVATTDEKGQLKTRCNHGGAEHEAHE